MGQVVLQKQLKEQAMAGECVKSSVVQDHSYVRPDHIVQSVDYEQLADAQLLLNLFHCMYSLLPHHFLLLCQQSMCDKYSSLV